MTQEMSKEKGMKKEEIRQLLEGRVEELMTCISEREAREENIGYLAALALSLMNCIEYGFPGEAIKDRIRGNMEWLLDILSRSMKRAFPDPAELGRIVDDLERAANLLLRMRLGD